MMKIIIWLWVGLALCQLTACRPILAPSPLQPQQTESPMIDPANPPPPSDLAASPLVEQARQDLAARLGITADQIEVVEATAVIWPDGSLGCPQPGMAYMQVQQDGLLIVLRANNQRYEYHSGGARPPFLCETAAAAPANGLAPAALPITSTQTMSVTLPTNPLVVQAMKDLGRRLAVRLEQITVVRAEATIWPDAGLGCPDPNMAYRQVQQDGMLIVLEVAGQAYNYHSGGARAPFLCENPDASSSGEKPPAENE